MKIWAVMAGLCFAALAAGMASAQPRMLIEYKQGTLDDLKGMRRFYVIAPTLGDRATIQQRINGRQGLRLMRHGTTAQFHVTYSCWRWAGARPEDPFTAELHVTIPRPDAVIINAWFKKESIPTCKNAAATTTLVKEFLKDFGEMTRRNR